MTNKTAKIWFNLCVGFFFFLLIWDCHTTQTGAGTKMRRRTVQTMVSKLCIEDSRSFLRLRWETWKQSWRRNCTWRAKAVWESSGAEWAQSGHRSSVLQRAPVSVGSKAGTEGAGELFELPTGRKFTKNLKGWQKNYEDTKFICIVLRSLFSLFIFQTSRGLPPGFAAFWS